MNPVIEELHRQLIQEELKEVIKKAYEQGLADGRSRYDLPILLTKKDLAKIFQVEMSTVNKIVGKRGFPKSRFVVGRYPRDEVFRWMDENSQK